MRSRRSYALITACVLAGASAASASAWGSVGGAAPASAAPVLRASASSALAAGHAGSFAERIAPTRAGRDLVRPALGPALASGTPASGIPASGIPASGIPASGIPASGPLGSGPPDSDLPASASAAVAADPAPLAGLALAPALASTDATILPPTAARQLAPLTLEQQEVSTRLTLEQQEAEAQLTLAEQAQALKERQAAAKAAAKAKAEAAAAAAKAAALAKAHRWVRPNYAGISSPFGMRWGRMHEGVDLAGQYGTPILAATSGTVIYAGPESGYGRIVKIQDWDGTQTWYGHMEKFLVKAGDKVTPGQQIALVGAEGDATGPHLHFEVHVGGRAIDPVPFMRARGINL